MISGHRPFCKFLATFTVVFEVLRIEHFEIWGFQRWKVRNFGYLNWFERETFRTFENLKARSLLSKSLKYRTFGNSGVCDLESLESLGNSNWKFGKFGTWKVRSFENLERKSRTFLKFGRSELWKFDALEIRNFSDAKIWRFQNMKNTFRNYKNRWRKSGSKLRDRDTPGAVTGGNKSREIPEGGEGGRATHLRCW